MAMNEYREQLIDRMVRLYGFENVITIQFCELCERYDNNADNDTMLRVLVEAHEQYPQRFFMN